MFVAQRPTRRSLCFSCPLQRIGAPDEHASLFMSAKHKMSPDLSWGPLFSPIFPRRKMSLDFSKNLVKVLKTQLLALILVQTSAALNLVLLSPYTQSFHLQLLQFCTGILRNMFRCYCSLCACLYSCRYSVYIYTYIWRTLLSSAYRKQKTNKRVCQHVLSLLSFVQALTV